MWVIRYYFNVTFLGLFYGKKNPSMFSLRGYIIMKNYLGIE